MTGKTTEHPHFRKRAFAAFYQYAERSGRSRKDARLRLAEEMGIEPRYCIIADMDETECVTVVAICNDPETE